jgi:hypothetical protein
LLPTTLAASEREIFSILYSCCCIPPSPCSNYLPLSCRRIWWPRWWLHGGKENPSRRQGTTAAAQELLRPRRWPGTYDGGYDELLQLPNATATATNVVADDSRRIWAGDLLRPLLVLLHPSRPLL